MVISLNIGQSAAKFWTILNIYIKPIFIYNIKKFMNKGEKIL